MLQQFLKSLSVHDRFKFESAYKIEGGRFSLEALQSMLSNRKPGDPQSTFINCDVVSFGSNQIKVCNSQFANCKFFGSSIITNDVNFKDITIEYCSIFISKNVTMEDCVFKNGAKEVYTTNPIIFNFDKGSIVNNKPGYIDFFGFTNNYKYFMDRLDQYPYSEYSSELSSIILAGVRE